MSESSEKTFSPFWPITLLGVAYLALGIWQISITLSSRSTYNEQLKAQATALEKGAKSQANMDKFYADLVIVSKNEPELKPLVERLQQLGVLSSEDK